MKFARRCDSTGVAMSSIGTGLAWVRDGLSLTSPDKDVRSRAITRLQNFIHLGADFGSVVIVGSHEGIGEGVDKSDRVRTAT